MKVEVRGTLFYNTSCVPGDSVILESEESNKFNPRAIKVMHVPRKWNPELCVHEYPFENVMVGYVADEQIEDVYATGLVDSQRECVCVLAKVHAFWIDTDITNPNDVLVY